MSIPTEPNITPEPATPAAAAPEPEAVPAPANEPQPSDTGLVIQADQPEQATPTDPTPDASPAEPANVSAEGQRSPVTCPVCAHQFTPGDQPL
jgi:hypothetical protein